MTIKVMVVDDQAVVRRGLAGIVEDTEGLEFVGEASDGETAIERVPLLSPDVVLMDVRMPGMGGIEAGRQIVAQHRGVVKVLIVTTFDLDAYVFESLRAGASGYIFKDSEPDDVVEAIQVVHAGDSLLAPSATRRLIAEFVRADGSTPPSLTNPPKRTDFPDPLGPTTDEARTTVRARPAPPLSEREEEVVVAVARGLSNAEIAAEMHLAQTTVKSHISSALTKWGARDRVQLVLRAFESGLAAFER